VPKRGSYKKNALPDRRCTIGTACPREQLLLSRKRESNNKTRRGKEREKEEKRIDKKKRPEVPFRREARRGGGPFRVGDRLGFLKKTATKGLF